ncbi:hypothetical protein ABEF95_005448 [Exophiala dermatitidis]
MTRSPSLEGEKCGLHLRPPEPDAEGWRIVSAGDVETGSTLLNLGAVFMDLPDDYARPWPGPDEIGKGQFANIIRKVKRSINVVMENLPVRARSLRPEDPFSRLIDYRRREYAHTGRFSNSDVLEALHGKRPRPGVEPSEEQKQDLALVGRWFTDVLEFDHPLFEPPGHPIFAFGRLLCSINHSCRPNVALTPILGEKDHESQLYEGTVGIRAIRPIKKDEEIKFSYVATLQATRERQRLVLAKNFGFDCRCDACNFEQHNATERDLKDVVYGLYNEVLESELDGEATTAPPVYRKAALVLDGFDALEINHKPKRDVLDKCGIHAMLATDSLRVHYFLSRALEWAKATYTDEAHRHIVDTKTQIKAFMREDWYDGEDAPRFGCSTYQEYDMNQDNLEELMFMMNHAQGDTIYRPLHVVNGEVEEMSVREHRKYLNGLRQPWKQKEQKRADRLRAINDKIKEMEAKDKLNSKRVSKQPKNEVKSIVQEDEEDEEDDEDEESEEEDEDDEEEEGDDEEEEGEGDEDEYEGEEDDEEVVSPPVSMPVTLPITPPVTPSASLPVSLPFKMPAQPPFVCPFGAKDGTSKQAWLQSAATKAALRLEPRDVGHLLAAKDGMGTNQEGFVLSARRDSVAGRIQGEKEFLQLGGRLGRKARTHSFGNDGSRKDLLKEAEVRESKCW